MAAEQQGRAPEELGRSWAGAGQELAGSRAHQRVGSLILLRAAVRAPGPPVRVPARLLHAAAPRPRRMCVWGCVT